MNAKASSRPGRFRPPRATSFVALTLLLLAAPASATQSRPDFSGEWTKLTPIRTTAPLAEMSVTVGVPERSPFQTISIEQGDDALAITSKDYRQQVRTFSHRLDGSEQQWRLTRDGLPAAPDEPAHKEGVISTASWDGDRIVLRMSEPVRELHIEQVLALDEAGRLILTTTGSAYNFKEETVTTCFVRSDTVDPYDREADALCR